MLSTLQMVLSLILTTAPCRTNPIGYLPISQTYLLLSEMVLRLNSCVYECVCVVGEQESPHHHQFPGNQLAQGSQLVLL